MRLIWIGGKVGKQVTRRLVTNLSRFFWTDYSFQLLPHEYIGVLTLKKDTTNLCLDVDLLCAEAEEDAGRATGVLHGYQNHHVRVHKDG